MTNSENERKQTDVAEVLDDLKMYQTDNLPVELWFDEDECCDGLIVDLADDFALIARLWQKSWLNGLRAVRLTAITEVLPCDDEQFICRAMLARGQVLPPVTPLQAQTMAELLETVCNHYPIVILNIEKPNEEPSDVAGTVHRVEQGVVTMRLISKGGFWIPEHERIELCHISQAMFGSEYEKTLFQIGELPDARTHSDTNAV